MKTNVKAFEHVLPPVSPTPSHAASTATVSAYHSHDPTAGAIPSTRAQLPVAVSAHELPTPPAPAPALQQAPLLLLLLLHRHHRCTRQLSDSVQLLLS